MGQEWAFRLTANPVKRHTNKQTDGGVRCSRTYCCPAASAGFVSVLPQWGFEVIPVLKVRMLRSARWFLLVRTLRFARRNADGKVGKVTHRKAQFDGALRITDVELFRKSLVSGMGRGKAYGIIF